MIFFANEITSVNRFDSYLILLAECPTKILCQCTKVILIGKKCCAVQLTHLTPVMFCLPAAVI